MGDGDPMGGGLCDPAQSREQGSQRTIGGTIQRRGQFRPIFGLQLVAREPTTTVLGPSNPKFSSFC